MPEKQPAQPALPPGSDEDRSPAYQAFLILLTVLVTASIVLRFWSRSLGARQMSGRGVNRFWWDDWVALLAAFFIWIFFGLAFAQVHLGFGRHIWMVPPQNLPIIFKLLYCIYYLYDVSLFLTKVSALLFLGRIFPKHANSKWWNYTLWSAHGLNVAWLLGIIFGTIFMCDPVQKGWNPMLPYGKCGETSALWIGSAVPSVFIDLVILLLPVPKIWSLRTSRGRKAGLLIVFILGYSVIIVSLGRMITVIKSSEALNKDITYEGMPMVYWVTCEAPATLISACLPPMMNLMRKANVSFFSPLSSKISSMWSTYTSNDSMSKSRDGTFTTGLKSADGKGRVSFRPSSNESYPTLADRDRSIHSMESRSGLVNNTPQAPAAMYQKDSHIPLSTITPRHEQYLASIESGGHSREHGHSKTPGQQILVNHDVSVSHQLR